MNLAIFDSSVLVTLAQKDSFRVLERIDPAFRKTVTDIVEGEMTAAPEKYVAATERVVYMDDGAGSNRARRELGDPARVRSSGDI